MTLDRWIDLACHPSVRPEAVRAVRVLVARPAPDSLQITFHVEGDIRRILVPAARPPRIGIELWRHTCLEAFVAVEGQTAYHEFNFSPSREWTVYAFTGYRNGGPMADETMAPDIAVRASENRLGLEAIIRLDRLSTAHQKARLRIGLAAVIEASDGISYWALRHPIDKPDFHNPAGFTLLLDPPGAVG